MIQSRGGEAALPGVMLEIVGCSVRVSGEPCMGRAARSSVLPLCSCASPICCLACGIAFSSPCGLPFSSSDTQPEGYREMSELVDYYKENARILRETFLAMGFSVFGGENAPYIWVGFPGRPSWDVFSEMLTQCNIVTTPGSGFGPAGEGFVRASAFGQRWVCLQVATLLSGNAACCGKVPLEAASMVNSGAWRMMRGWQHAEYTVIPCMTSPADVVWHQGGCTGGSGEIEGPIWEVNCTKLNSTTSVCMTSWLKKNA